jgi:hypothetical protein
LGIAACFLLGTACLVAAIFETRIILHLVNEGQRTGATVVGIERGAKGAKWAVYRFTTETGATVTLRDAFAMYLVRPRRAESLTVLYDPSRPGLVTADLGLWIWQGPMIFAGGFVLLLGLGILLIRAERTIRK